MSKVVTVEGDQRMFSPDHSGRILAQWDIEGMIDIRFKAYKLTLHDINRGGVFD